MDRTLSVKLVYGIYFLQDLHSQYFFTSDFSRFKSYRHLVPRYLYRQFLPCDALYALSGIAVVSRPSVCLSVRPSVSL